MPRILIEIDEQDLRRIIHEYLMKTLGEVQIDEQYIKIEVKSSQNFRAEWETAKFRAVYERMVK